MVRKFVVVALLWCLLCGGKSALGQPSQIIVGANVHVSKSRPALVHNEVLLASDPDNPDRLLGCTMAFAPALNKTVTIAYASFDAGKSWEFVVTNDAGILSGDPACTFGPKNTAYFTAIQRSESNSDQLVVYRSQDGGKTWSAPSTLLASAPAVDRPYVIVDQSESSHRGRVYIYGQIVQRTVDGEVLGLSIALWRSRDGGITYEGPMVRSRDKTFTYHPANSVVLSDGTLVCLVAELDSQKRNDGFAGSQYRKPDVQNGVLKALVSADGGESFGPASRISDIYEDWREQNTGIASLAVDRTSAGFRDRLYAVWADGRYGRTQILLSYSTDKGKTWSRPELVSDGEPVVGDGPDNFMPVVAVNPDGVVGVMWYDRREVRDTYGYHVRFTASLDGGETWLPSVRVSEKPKTLDMQRIDTVTSAATRAGSNGPLLIFLRRFDWIAGGHTAGLAADSRGIFHPFWVDNRTGVSQIWTAPVTVKGVVARNGSAELAELEDVSPSLMVDLTNCAYHNTSNTVSCDAKLKNTSTKTLQGPFALRMTAVRSELGELRVLDADNGQTGAGAVWNFRKPPGDGLLKPNETSESKQLSFQLSNVRPFRQGNSFKYGIVAITARVLGHTKKSTP